MKIMCRFRVLLLSVCLPFFAPAQQSWNLPLLSNWDDDAIPNAWTGAFSECWGYAANGREYAFIASTQGTYFFDITEPTSPVMLDFIRTRDTTALVVNMDYATYSHYLYAVSDQGENSMQIFDLQYLPDSVIVAYDDNDIAKRCHTIFVENDKLYMCSLTGPFNSHENMAIYSLADPVNPVFLGSLPPSSYNVHEVFVQNDTAYCAMGYNGLWIYDVSNPVYPAPVSSIENYPEFGYNHSAWLTANGKVMAFTDENHGKGVKLYDMTDIEDPRLISMLRSNMLMVSNPQTDDGSVAHNPYIVGNILLLSYYHDGVVAYDISDPAAPEKIAWYDTHPQSTNYNSYKGCWGLYPFLPSGNIVASDINNGLFILDGNEMLNYINTPDPLPSLFITGNPVRDELEVFFTSGHDREASLKIYDITGQLVSQKEFKLSVPGGNMKFPVHQLSSGIYVVSIASEVHNLTEKIIIVN